MKKIKYILLVTTSLLTSCARENCPDQIADMSFSYEESEADLTKRLASIRRGIEIDIRDHFLTKEGTDFFERQVEHLRVESAAKRENLQDLVVKNRREREAQYKKRIDEINDECLRRHRIVGGDIEDFTSNVDSDSFCEESKKKLAFEDDVLKYFDSEQYVDNEAKTCVPAREMFGSISQRRKLSKNLMICSDSTLADFIERAVEDVFNQDKNSRKKLMDAATEKKARLDENMRLCVAKGFSEQQVMAAQEAGKIRFLSEKQKSKEIEN